MTNNKVAVKGTAILASGSMLAQAIALLLTPVITRMYAPEQFGLFSTVLALAMPIAAVSSLRYFDAIMLPKENDEASEIFKLSIMINVVCALLLLVVIHVFMDPLAETFGFNGTAWYLYFVPAFVIVLGVRRVLDAWLQRKKSYISISVTTIVTSVTDRVVTILLGFMGIISSTGLLAGKMAGMIAGLAVMAVNLIRAVEKEDQAHGDYSIKQVAKKYSSFAKYSWSALVMQLTMELPVLVIGAFYNPAVVGLYVLSRRVLMEPAILIGEALSKTFYVKAAELHKRNEDLSGVCSSLLKVLFKLSIPPMCVFLVASPDLFSFIFGEEWRVAGTYAVYLTPMFLVGFFLQPLTRLFNVLDKQRELAAFSLLRLVGISIAMLIGVALEEPEYLFVCLSVATVVIGTSRVKWMFDQIGVNTRSVIADLVKNLILGLILASVVYFIDVYFVLDELYMTLLFSFVCASYYIYEYKNYKLTAVTNDDSQ